MKKITVIGMATLMLGIGTLNTGCMGSWKLTKSMYSWNDKATGNKYLNNILFWAFIGIQVYTITFIADGFIFNLVEFWSGSNPMSMQPGEKETQIVKGKDGNKYEITATQNRFDFMTLSGDKKGERTAIVYKATDQSWNVERNGLSTKIMQIHEDINKVEVFHADGSVTMHDMSKAEINSVLKTGLSN
jgi:hypothetical protein